MKNDPIHKMSFQIEFQPLGLRDRILPGQSLLDCARQKEIDLVSLCGGKGTCGKCKVQIVKGDVTEPPEEERKRLSSKELADGYRFACKTYPRGDLVLNIPPESLSAPQRLQLEGQETSLFHDPFVRTYPVSLPAPSLTDLRGDDQRLFDALEEQHGIPCDRFDELVAQTFPLF